MEVKPETLRWQSVYKLLIGSVLPRPIGWISTVNGDGVRNLAPFSFFNVVCPNPPHVLFCPNIRGSDGRAKDTLQNVRATGQFVANIVTEPLVRAMNLSSTDAPHGVDEFQIAGLTAVPSVAVRPPRVGESPIHFECTVTKIVDLGHEPGGGSVVIGRIVHLHVQDDVLLAEDKIDLERLQPVGRLAGNGYCRITDRFELARPPAPPRND